MSARCQRWGCTAYATHRVSVHRKLGQISRARECDAHSLETYEAALQDVAVEFAVRRPFAPAPIVYRRPHLGAVA